MPPPRWFESHDDSKFYLLRVFFPAVKIFESDEPGADVEKGMFLALDMPGTISVAVKDTEAYFWSDTHRLYYTHPHSRYDDPTSIRWGGERPHRSPPPGDVDEEFKQNLKDFVVGAALGPIPHGGDALALSKVWSTIVKNWQGKPQCVVTFFGWEQRSPFPGSGETPDPVFTNDRRYDIQNSAWDRLDEIDWHKRPLKWILDLGSGTSSQEFFFAGDTELSYFFAVQGEPEVSNTKLYVRVFLPYYMRGSGEIGRTPWTTSDIVLRYIEIEWEIDREAIRLARKVEPSSPE